MLCALHYRRFEISADKSLLFDRRINFERKRKEEREKKENYISYIYISPYKDLFPAATLAAARILIMPWENRAGGPGKREYNA